MLSKLIGPRVIAGLLIGLVLGLALLWWQHGRDVARLEAARADVATARANVDAAIAAAAQWEGSLARERARSEQLVEALATRSAKQAQIEREAATWRRRYQERVRDDPECAAWSAGRLPACVIDRLRELSGTAGGASTGGDPGARDPGDADDADAPP